jgi:hypothetical protein
MLNGSSAVLLLHPLLLPMDASPPMPVAVAVTLSAVAATLSAMAPKMLNLAAAITLS